MIQISNFDENSEIETSEFWNAKLRVENLVDGLSPGSIAIWISALVFDNISAS